jgi:hypothetical protein
MHPTHNKYIVQYIDMYLHIIVQHVQLSSTDTDSVSVSGSQTTRYVYIF